MVLPPSVAASFVRDLRAFLDEPNELKREEIATRQLHILEKFRLPDERELRLSDVKEMFEQMKFTGVTEVVGSHNQARKIVTSRKRRLEEGHGTD